MSDREDAVERLNALKQLIGYDKDSEIVKATQKSLDMAIKALEQEPRKGHWINKHQLFEFGPCSAECSSCHKRSNGYAHDNGFSLEFKYYDFCPKCGSDNREVVEE
jgi:Zn finger protein HypA/HybF involved in hydrogenase expression